jgi:uncharacterized repeat protein (TIGR03803 family)
MRFKVLRAAIAATSFFALSVLRSPAPAATQYNVLHSFCPSGTCTDGRGPSGKPLLDASGNLYGTTSVDSGVAFSLSPKGKETVLHQFCAPCGEGTMPVGDLIMDVNGDLYGTTAAAGAGSSGTIFKLTHGKRKNWKLTTLYSFCTQTDCADGGPPAAGLTYDGAQSGALYDGTSALYGTTYRGGAANSGVAFELSFKQGKSAKAGVYKVIYDFCAKANCADGGFPQAALLADGKGNFYGTGSNGGKGNPRDGVLFELARKHQKFAETVLYSFCQSANCADGNTPGPIVSDAAGNIFGAALGGGANGLGAVFEVTPAGSESVLHSFCAGDCSDGGQPNGITLAPDGSLWGTTSLFGANGDGTLFRLQDGTFSVVHAFCSALNCSDGAEPVGGVTFDGAGNAFGTASAGATGGTVYEVEP